MHIQPNGQILIRLKRAWMDGTQHLEFSPIELLEKLAALVPPPRVNQVLYHGVLAPRAKWRHEIVPKSSEPEAFKPLRKCANHSPRRRHALWAELLWNSFGFDGWACFHCGDPSIERIGRQRTTKGGYSDEAWRCGMRAGNGVVRVAVGNWGIWGRFAPVLRGLVEKSNDF